VDISSSKLNETVILLGRRLDLVEKLRNRGYFVVLGDEVPHPHASAFVPLAEEQALYGVSSVDLSPFKQFQNVVSIIANNDLYIELAARLRLEIYRDLKGLDPEKAEVIRDKFLCKSKVAQANIPSAKFTDIGAAAFEDIVKKISLPFLVKPKKLFVSRGIRKIATESDWESFLSAVGNQKDRYYAEQFINVTKELSCDTIILNKKVIAQFPCEYSVNCLESSQKHEGFGAFFSPSLPNEEIERMKAMTVKILGALSIDTAYCHIEFLGDKNEILFGEISVRLAGGLHPQTESLIIDKDVQDIFLDLHLSPNSVPNFYKTSSKVYGYYLYPKKPGRVIRISNQLDEKDWVVEAKVLVEVGDQISFEDSSVATLATVIFSGSNSVELHRHFDEVRRLLTIDIEKIPAETIDLRGHP